MEFNLSTFRHFYTASAAEKLQPLGFSFEEIKPLDSSSPEKWLIKGRETVTIEINSLEELIALSEKYGPLEVSANRQSICIIDGFTE